ncbi:hypothetical protein ACFLZN_01605 [Nanoarchaeota archaeon]
MILKERIYNLLKDGHKTTKYLQQKLSDKHSRNLAATISNNKDIFVRLDRGLVGLRDRDEKLVQRTVFFSRLAIWKKVFNLLRNEPLSMQEIYDALPDTLRVSIRANISMNKDKFIYIKQGVVGLKGRDEHLIKPKPPKIPKQKPITIAMLIKQFLATGPKSLGQIYTAFPEFKKKSITSKLALDKGIIKIGREKYTLKNT